MTHKETGQHGGENDFIVIPECICPDNEKAFGAND